MNIWIPRGLYNRTPVRDGLKVLTGADHEVVSAYTALRLIDTLFSRAPHDAEGVEVWLSRDAARNLADVLCGERVAGHAGLAQFLLTTLSLTKEQDEPEEVTGRPPMRTTTRTDRGYGFRR